MNNIAENHLSKYGRFGDTEMYRTTKTGPGKGELWHVNPQEKSLMDMYGQSGEKLVDLIGSGTKNPITNKEEKWLATAALFGLSLYQGAEGASNLRESARETLGLIDSQQDALDKSSIKLDESVKAKRNLITKKSKKELGEISKITGNKMESIFKETEKISGGTGFAHSGQVENIKNESIEDTRESFKSMQEELSGEYGKSLGEISGMYDMETARIKAEKDRLSSERKLVQAQSKRKFLGIF